MHFEFLGAANRVYAIEASTNLVYWVKMGACAADAEGKVRYTDPDATSPLAGSTERWRRQATG